jgi:hypothetical protein
MAIDGNNEHLDKLFIDLSLLDRFPVKPFQPETTTLLLRKRPSE